MEYEQFFPTQNDNTCNCYGQIKIALVSISCIAVLIDCISSCRMRNKIKKLKKENSTLKNIILKSVDQTFTKILKNGYQIDNSDDE